MYFDIDINHKFGKNKNIYQPCGVGEKARATTKPTNNETAAAIHSSV